MQASLLKIMHYCVVILILMATSTLSYAEERDDAIGQIKTLSGSATVERDGKKMALWIGSKLFQKDTIITGPKGQIGMTFIDNTMFSAGPDTEIALDQFNFDTTTYQGVFKSDVRRGTLAAVSGKIAKHSPGNMTVKTPSAILGVRGTRFLVAVEGE